LERYYFPVLVALVGVGISSWLAIALPPERLSALGKAGLLAVAAGVAGLVFWLVARQGSFVLAASRTGIYYRQVNAADKLVFIPWDVVSNVAVYDDGSRELEIETVWEGQAKLPTPCNGTSFVKKGRLAVALYPGMARKTSDIMGKMASLRPPSRDPA
jgi:hypothetical protein